MDCIKESKAKKASLQAMTLSAIWIMLHTVAKGVLAAFHIEYLPTMDIILTGICIGGIYSPVTVSIWIDKLIELKKAGFDIPTGGQG